MTSYYNKVILMATVSTEPNFRKCGELAICDFTICLNEKFHSSEGWKTEATFVDVTCFNRTADFIASQLTKGDTVLVEGRLKQERWEKDGAQRSKLKINAEKVLLVPLLTKKEQREQEQERDRRPFSPIASKVQRTSDEIPF